MKKMYDQVQKKEHRIKFAKQPLNYVKPFTKRLSIGVLRAIKNSDVPNEKRFIIVRHPFHRLVSAFRDKIERQHGKSLERDWYYNTYGKKIVSMYRRQALKKFGHAHFDSDHNFGAVVPVNGMRDERLPIFWEFVQFIIRTHPATMDEHWKPQSDHCSACGFPYQTVILFERLQEEGAFLKYMLTNRSTSYLNEEDNLQKVNENPSGLGIEDLTNKYFQLLSDSDISKLYKIYQYDFKLFGYTFTFRNITYS